MSVVQKPVVAPYRGSVACGLGGFDLFERHALFDHVLNTISNDGDHIAVLDDVMIGVLSSWCQSIRGAFPLVNIKPGHTGGLSPIDLIP